MALRALDHPDPETQRRMWSGIQEECQRMNKLYPLTTDVLVAYVDRQLRAGDPQLVVGYNLVRQLAVWLSGKDEGNLDQRVKDFIEEEFPRRRLAWLGNESAFHDGLVKQYMHAFLAHVLEFRLRAAACLLRIDLAW
jgi:hypothetical protein